jgi:uncharacterized protein YacL
MRPILGINDLSNAIKAIINCNKNIQWQLVK